MVILASRIFLAPALMSGYNHKEQKSRSVLVDQRFKLPTSGSEKSRETLVVRERKHIVCFFFLPASNVMSCINRPVDPASARSAFNRIHLR